MGDEAELKKCPFCAELIRAEAVVCRFCNRDIQNPSPVTGGPRAATTSDIVQKGVAKDADRRSIQFEVRRRRLYSRMLVGVGTLSAIGAAITGSNGHEDVAKVAGLGCVMCLVAAAIMKPKYTGAECPHCHGFAVRRVTRSGVFSSSQNLHCDDCLADFGGVSSGCGCVVLVGSLLALASTAVAAACFGSLSIP